MKFSCACSAVEHCAQLSPRSFDMTGSRCSERHQISPRSDDRNRRCNQRTGRRNEEVASQWSRALGRLPGTGASGASEAPIGLGRQIISAERGCRPVLRFCGLLLVPLATRYFAGQPLGAKLRSEQASCSFFGLIFGGRLHAILFPLQQAFGAPARHCVFACVLQATIVRRY